MIAEYAHCYGGPPAPEMPWPLFRALLDRVGRFNARALLGQIVASGHASGEATGQLRAIAWPEQGPPIFALKQSPD